MQQTASERETEEHLVWGEVTRLWAEKEYSTVRNYGVARMSIMPKHIYMGCLYLPPSRHGAHLQSLGSWGRSGWR